MPAECGTLTGEVRPATFGPVGRPASCGLSCRKRHALLQHDVALHVAHLQADQRIGLAPINVDEAEILFEVNRTDTIGVDFVAE